MNDFWYRYNDLSARARIGILAGIILTIFCCVYIALSNLQPTEAATNETQTKTATPAPKLPASRFIFGTNLSPSDDKYETITSQTTQGLLQEMHIQMVRIPLEKPLSDAVITQAAQGVKTLNAVPLVNLYDPFAPKSQEENSKIIKIMNKVFGQTTVYYEYGNEDDAAGISAEDYTAAWNKAVPDLKKLAPGAHFIGPATYRYTEQYFQTFLKQANPLPDEISWHEYTCNAAESQQICTQRLNNWSSDIRNARTTMTKVLGKSLPIVISEWNYAANAKANDGKANDSKFLVSWMTKALQILSDNQIFASMQYSCTGTTPLITNDELTPQGEAFMNLYENYVTNRSRTKPGATPTATLTDTPTSTPTATPTPSPTPTPTVAPPPEIVPTPTPWPTPTPTPMAQPTPTPSPTLIVGSTPLVTPTPGGTPTVTPTMGATPTDTPTPEMTPTIEATSTVGSTPTVEITPTSTSEVTPTVEASPTTTPDETPTPESTPIVEVTPTSTVTGTPTTGITPTATKPTTPPQITASMTPTQVYQAATSGPLLYTSSLLKQGAASWDVKKFTGGGSCGFTTVGYQVNMPQRNYFASCMAQSLSYKNFTIQIAMKITSGTANDGGGIIFRDNGKGSYRFRVNLDGTWDCAPLNISGSSSAIKKGLNQTNILTIVAEGSDLYFFINQQYITHVTDSSFSAGRLGLMAVDWNGTTNVSFNNIKVWQLR
ncbi:hypothetical protein KSF_014510 [Reticulibacter mediterranei]|uniref:3-keto-disaccharide hydrolase domain-containing protein n=1 Tax=Reticulibacter mediterranei TaxID=2778369 RepID=A0A8J3N0E2_9CHLR|nr:hypothetical protein [Reticulibacter mediterranei]GHO91403.1 hypothetical protein KSF_014510 [Reticulibacter mediterranei]